MANVYTLDTLRASLDHKYAPVEIDLGGNKSVVLRNLMRLPKGERTKVLEAMNELQGENQDADDIDKMLDGIKTILGLVAADNKGKLIVDAIGDDLALGMHIMELWTEATQPGEAQNSPV